MIPASGSLSCQRTLGCVLLIATLVSCTVEEPLPSSGVLITVDTTNAGALDVYGKNRGFTPAVSKLATEGLTFDRAYTTAPITLPAHTSMLTGLYPLRHGVRENGLMRLSPQAETLAERAHEAGFQTAAFVSAMVLAKTYGLDQGFDVYEGPRQHTQRIGAGITERRSNEVTDAALAWLQQRDKGRPFFLWVHYFDAHAPYEPPPKFLQMTGGNNYLGEVAAMDVDIGRLLQALDEEVGKDKLMLALVADHGESLDRHGESSHGAFCYNPTTKIPFILRFPDGRLAGERREGLVSVVDLFPTFLEQLGLGSSSDLDGLNLSLGDVPADRGVYVESYYGYYNFGWSPLGGWVDDKGKYLHSSKPEYYDLNADPRESENLFGAQGLDLSRYRDSIAALSNRPRLLSGGEVELNQEEVLELRKLGYAALGSLEGEGPPDPLEPSTAPAPSDEVESYYSFAVATRLQHDGKNEEAEKVLREILERQPKHVAALETLGVVLLELKRFAESAEYFERTLQVDASRYPSHVHLASAWQALGDKQKALKHLRAARLIRPDEPKLAADIKRLERGL